MRRLAPALVAVLTLLPALPAAAGLFSDDEARARIDALRKDVDAVTPRLAAIDQKAADLSQRAETLSRGQLDLANQITAVVADVAKLRGQLEVMSNDIDSAQKRQKDFYIDLDNRLRKIELQMAQQAEQQKAAAAAPAVDPQAETRDYEAALTNFKATKYKEAAAAFAAFIKAYPSSALQPSAHFWAAASLRQQRELDEAARMFGEFADKWPDDPKAPDALLAKADCEHDAHALKNERATLESLVKRYPDSAASRSARQRLKKK